MIVENLFKPKPTVVEGSAANDYFTRRNSEEERIAGTRAPVKNKKNPANTDYSKRRAQEKKVEQGVAEAINPDITNPEFSHQQQIGDYLYVARYWSKGLKITAYHGNKQIGYAELMYQSAPFDDFADPKTTPKRIWLESEWTKVDPKYQRQGIMSTMYAYAKMLGNSVKPSQTRSDDAKAAWKSWRQSGDAQHLTREGVAEAFGPLPKPKDKPLEIQLGRHTVEIDRVGKDKDSISFAWHDSQDQDHYVEVPVGELRNYDDLIDRIKDEISYQERQYTDQGVAEGNSTSELTTVQQGISGDQIANHKNYKQYYNQALAGQNTARAHQTAQQIATLKVKADMARGINEQGVAEGSGDNDDIKRLKAGNSTSDGIDMQDIRLMAGEGKLTKKTVLQAIAVIRKQREQQGVAESDHQSSSKTGIYQTEVYGSKAYHSKCLEKGCDWESRRFDRIKQAQDAAKKHAQKHLKSNVKEDAAGDLGTIPTTEFVKGIYSLAAEYGAEAPDPEQVKKMMVLAPNREVDIQKTFQKIIATFQAQLPKITQMMSELDAIIKQADVQEGKSDLQEIQRTKGDEEGLSTKGQNWDKETLAKIKMLPGSQRFGYTAGDAGRASSFLTGADTIIELFDVKHPQDGLRKAGFLSLRSAPWFPIKNSYQVANVGLDSEYRGQGLGQNLYGVAMKLLGMTIVADDTQTPQARSSWLRLSQVPGVAINGYTSVFPDEWALRNNRNEIYDDSAKRLISSLLKAGGQEIGKNPDFVYVSFPVGANADQNELQALQKGITIYSARHPEDGGTQNGLYARWGGQVNEQGDDPWGPQGNFAGDKPINVGDVTMKIIQVGDIVKYLGQRARVVGMSKNRKYSRISIESEFGGITKDVLTADLKQLGQGVKEGSKRKKKKTSRSLGRYFFPGYGYYGSGESGGGSGDGGGGESINRGVAEGEEQQLSLQQLATISDEALDKAYGYGRSSPGNTFGWQANLKSAAYAKQMIDKGITDIEEISDAIHKGWNVTAKAFVQDPDQFDDTEKLKAAGKLEAKLQQRERLMNINYSQLPDDEQEKDRVVARALLRAINGRQDVEEARMSAAQRLSMAWDKQRAKSDASLRRTPSSIPKSTPEPKKPDTEPKTVSESRVKRRALMAQMLNNR